MKNQEMPQWMMDYVANIGTDECYKEFRKLSEEYHTNRDRYKSVKSHVPKHMPNGEFDKGTQTKQVEVKPDDIENRKINKAYKEKSLELAGKYGYKRPADKDVFSPKIKEIRENFATKKERTDEDLLAETAHRNYQKNHPEKALKFKDNKTKYRERELYEIDASRSAENDTRGFNIAQDRFEETRQSEVKKGDKSFENMTQGIEDKFTQNAKDITEPDPANPSNPDAKNSKHMDESEPDPNNGNSGGSKNAYKEADKSDTSKYNISSRFFTSLSINKNKMEQLSNKSVNQDKGIDVEKKNLSERFFKDIGFDINKSDITKKNNDDKSSISYSFNKTSDKSTSKSVDLEKD